MPSTQVKCVSRPPPVALQRGDQAALGAQAEPVGGVLDVAAGDRAAVVDEGGGADREAGVGGVRPGHRRRGPASRSASQSTSRSGGCVTCPGPSGSGRPSALGIRSRCADSASTSSVMTYGVAPTNWLGHLVGQQRTRATAARGDDRG